MGTDTVVMLGRHLLLETSLLCLPLLAAACAISLVTSLLQTLTGLQEQTLSTVPRLIVVALVALATLPWMVHRLVVYTALLWTDLQRYTA